MCGYRSFSRGNTTTAMRQMPADAVSDARNDCTERLWSRWARPASWPRVRFHSDASMSQSGPRAPRTPRREGGFGRGDLYPGERSASSTSDEVQVDVEVASARPPAPSIRCDL